MACTAINTTDALLCISDNLDYFNSLFFGLLVLLVIAGLIFIIYNLNFKMWPDQTKEIFMQATYLLSGWLLAPVLNMGLSLINNNNSFIGIYTAYFWFMIVVSTVYFIFFLFWFFSKKDEVLK